MVKAGSPIGVGMKELEFILPLKTLMLMSALQFIIGRERRRLGDEVYASLVERHRVSRGENAEISHHSGIIMIPAVALRLHIHNERYVEIGLILEHSLSIFCNLAVEISGSVP